MTGQTKSQQVVLHHLATDGTSIWRSTYQPGNGRSITRLTDGYIIAGYAAQNVRGFASRTDNAGNTSPMEISTKPWKRRVQNTLLSTEATPTASMFFDGEMGLIAPKDSLTHLFFSAAPWLGALDQEGILHTSMAVYKTDSMTGYRSGMRQGPAADFARVWWVSRAQVENLRQDWADNGVLNQILPDDIATWPAKGNARFSHNLDFTKTTTDKLLLPAPFMDANNDGLYNPADGDYPRIKGDQMAWWLLSDSTAHNTVEGVPLIMDMGISMYLFNCAYEKLENSLFVDYEIINRSPNAYHQMFMGIWSDPDLGCPYDDYVGTLASANAMYAYNQDIVDGQVNTECAGGVHTFSSNIPTGTLTFINSSLDHTNWFTSANILAGNQFPPAATTVYQLLKGVSFSGLPIDNFFPGNPADPNMLSMCSDSVQNQDFRFLGSHGPFILTPDDTFRLSVAFTYHPDIPLPCPDIFGTVQNDLTDLRALLNSGALDAPAQLPAIAYLPAGQTVTLDATVPGATGYTWSNGATTPVISVNQPGNYTVTITRVTGCTSVELVVIQGATAVETPAWLDHLRLFPNPSASSFQVEIRGAGQGKMEFTLYNALGQCVERETEDFSNGSINRTFDYRHLPNGIYSLRLRSGDKMRVVKIILQR